VAVPKIPPLVIECFRPTTIGRYDEMVQFKADDVKETIHQAGEFLVAVKSYLEM
jgi:hypothetical protein